MTSHSAECSGSAAQKAAQGIPNLHETAPAFCVSLNPVVGPCISQGIPARQH